MSDTEEEPAPAAVEEEEVEAELSVLDALREVRHVWNEYDMIWNKSRQMKILYGNIHPSIQQQWGFPSLFFPPSRFKSLLFSVQIIALSMI